MTTSLSKTKEHGRYLRLKKKLIGRFGTLSKASAVVGCHPNAFREVCNGKCPGIRDRLRDLGMWPKAKNTEVNA